MKYSKVYIGVLNNKNFEKLQELQYVKDNLTILISNLDIANISKENLDFIKTNSKNIVFLSSKKNISDLKIKKKSKDYTLFIDWILSQPKEIKVKLSNDSLLFVCQRDENWHNEYDGGLGFGVSVHEGIETIFYGHSVSLPNSLDKLLLKEFDGYFLQNI